MDQSLFETLLLQGESDALDFKRDQYPFEGAADDAKSELLKDILAFANAWRGVEAYILIGVGELKGGRASKFGITSHLEDASLQQFVNSKTQKPVTFRYESIEITGLSFGIISIPVLERPFFLKKAFAKLEAQKVYVRRGTATVVADPDEIAKMGLAQTPKIEPDFLVTAQPRIRHQRAIVDLHIHFWLQNSGIGTGDDVVVRIKKSPAGLIQIHHGLWIDESEGAQGKAQRLKKPIHPNESVILFWIGLGAVDLVIANPCRFVLQISARDRSMLRLTGEFSPEELRAQLVKRLELSLQ